MRDDGKGLDVTVGDVFGGGGGVFCADVDGIPLRVFEDWGTEDGCHVGKEEEEEEGRLGVEIEGLNRVQGNDWLRTGVRL